MIPVCRFQIFLGFANINDILAHPNFVRAGFDIDVSAE
jgi:hypothetical protein